MDSKPLSRNQHLVPTPFRSGSAKFTPEGHTQAVRNAKKFLRTKDSGSSWIYLAKKKSTSTNTVFCDFIKRCFQDSQASGCRCCKPYNNNKKKQQQIKKTEWDGGKSFPIALFLPKMLNKATPSVPVTSLTSYILANDLPLQVLQVRSPCFTAALHTPWTLLVLVRSFSQSTTQAGFH